MEFHHRNGQSIKSLVDMGAKGHFPLFEKSWIEEVCGISKKLTGNEKLKAKKILSRVSQHKSLERKKTLLISLPLSERNLFVRAFLNMVESKVLDLNLELQ